MSLRAVIALCVSLIVHIVLFFGAYILFKEEDRIAKLSTHTKTVVLAMNLVKPTPDAPPAPIAVPPKPPEPVKKPPVEKPPEPPKPKKKPKKPKKKPVKKKKPPKKKVAPKPVEPTPPPIEYVDPTPVVTPPITAAPTPTSASAATSAPYSPNPVPPGAVIGTTPQTAGVRSLKGTVTYRFVIGQSDVSDQSGSGQRLNCGGRKPPYPKKAQRRNIEGTVNISFTADNSGRITKARIIKASHPFLNDRKILKFLRRHCNIPN